MGNKHVFSIYRLSVAPEALFQSLTDRGFREIPTADDGSRLFVAVQKSKVPNALQCLRPLASDPKWIPPEETQVHTLAAFSTASSSWYIVGSGPTLSLVQGYVVPTLGLDLICRLASPDVIVASDSSLFTGPVTHESRIYRGRRSSAWDFANVSRLFHRFVAKVQTTDIETDLGLMNLRGKKLRISGGTAVKVHHLTSLAELRMIISRLDEILSWTAKFTPLMGASSVSSRGRKELQEAFLDDMGEWLAAAANGTLHIEDLPVLSNDDPRFFLSDNYTLILGSANRRYEDIDFAQVLTFINERNVENIDAATRALRIHCSVDGERFEEPLMKCLQAEVHLQGEWYFLLHGHWYKLSNEFGASIERYVGGFLVHAPFTVSHSPGDSEDLYLDSVLRTTGAKLFHRKSITENLELCDILYLTAPNAEPCLVFVKRGTGQAVRALVAQATESATRLYQDTSFLNLALAKVHDLAPEAEPSLAERRFSVHLVVLDDKSPNGAPLLQDLSSVAKLNLALGIQSLVGLGVRSIGLSIVA